MESKLKMQGNPLKLTPLTYILVKILSIIIVLILSMVGDNNIVLTIVCAAFAYYGVDLLYYFSDKDDNRKILEDLPDICDILDVQTSAGVNLGLALTELYDIPKSKRLRRCLSELAAEINLTKNPEKALDNFISNFNILELESFTLAIKQAMKTGKSKEILNNQSDMLKEESIFRVQAKTKTVDTQFLFIAILIFSGIVVLIFYAFKIILENSIYQIF